MKSSGSSRTTMADQKNRNVLMLGQIAILLVTCILGVATMGRADEAIDPSHEQTVLGIEGSRFTVNDNIKFLLGISYYGGSGATKESVSRDLDDLQRFGFNWLRVFGTWESADENVSAVDDRGEAREPYLSRLQSLVAECDNRGIIVDVTLARSKRSNGSAPSVHLPDLAAHRRAVETIIKALAPHRNWYLDLANERDVRDDRFVSVEESNELRQLARTLNSSLLVTASFGGHDLSSNDIRDTLEIAGADFLSVHRPRHAKSPLQTETHTREVLALLERMGVIAPIHYQEPFRRGYVDWEPTAADFLTDLRGAVAGGAAGWCFHNGLQRSAEDQQPRRSFDLRSKRLFDQLDNEELQFVAAAKKALVAD
jgi:hypothetical protein